MSIVDAAPVRLHVAPPSFALGAFPLRRLRDADAERPLLRRIPRVVEERRELRLAVLAVALLRAVRLGRDGEDALGGHGGRGGEAVGDVSRERRGADGAAKVQAQLRLRVCLLYTSPSPRD